MSDPPLPLSPFSPSQTSPTPKAANSRTFWRHLVGRVTRTTPTPTLPDLDLSTQPPPSPAPTTKLVEINVTNRQHTDPVRRNLDHSVNPSAFHDLPPAQVYDPAWNTNPLRREAGRLGPQTSGPNSPVLPGAFTIKSSDLEDDDDDDTPASLNTPTPSATPHHSAPPPPNPNYNESPLRSRLSLSLRKYNPATPLVHKITRSTVIPPSRFESPLSLNATIENLKLVLQRHIRAHILSVKPTEIRARVPIGAKHNSPTYVIVVSIDHRPNTLASHLVYVRRSFADGFRISTKDFDNFCSEFQKRFRELHQLTTR